MPKKPAEGYVLGPAESAVVAKLVRAAMDRRKVTNIALSRYSFWTPAQVSDLLADPPRRPWTRSKVQTVAAYLEMREADLLPGPLSMLGAGSETLAEIVNLVESVQEQPAQLERVRDAVAAALKKQRRGKFTG